MTRRYGWERNNLPRKETDWTPELVDRLRGLWAEGLSAAEIGRRLGVSKSTICGKKKRLGLQDRPSPIIRDGAPKQKQGVRCPPLDPEAHARALMLMRAGWSNLKIVKEYGGSEWQLRKVREDAGIPKKDTNGPERGSCAAGRKPLPVCLVPRQMFAPRQKTADVVEFKPPSPRQCTWVTEGDRPMQWIRCEHDMKRGSSWCETHHSVVFVKRNVAA